MSFGTAQFNPTTSPCRQWSAGGAAQVDIPSLPRLVASSDLGNHQTLIRLLSQIAARQATVGSAA